MSNAFDPETVRADHQAHRREWHRQHDCCATEGSAMDWPLWRIEYDDGGVVHERGKTIQDAITSARLARLMLNVRRRLSGSVTVVRAERVQEEAQFMDCPKCGKVIDHGHDCDPDPVCADCGGDLDTEGKCKRDCANAPALPPQRTNTFPKNVVDAAR